MYEPICRPTSDAARVVSQDVRRHFADRRREKPLRRLRVRQQRLHLPPQRFVVVRMPPPRTRRARAHRGRARRRTGLRHAAGARGRSPPFSFELAKQPEFRQSPVAFDRVGRHVEHLGRLLHAQAAEEPQLDRPGSSARRPPPMPPRRDPAPRRPTPVPATRRALRPASPAARRRRVCGSRATARDRRARAASGGPRSRESARGPAIGRCRASVSRRNASFTSAVVCSVCPRRSRPM